MKKEAKELLPGKPLAICHDCQGVNSPLIKMFDALPKQLTIEEQIQWIQNNAEHYTDETVCDTCGGTGFVVMKIDTEILNKK